MIRGLVNARHEAVVSLRLRGPQGLETTLEAIVDSGFTASLTTSFSECRGNGDWLRSGAQVPVPISWASRCWTWAMSGGKMAG